MARSFTGGGGDKIDIGNIAISGATRVVVAARINISTLTDYQRFIDKSNSGSGAQFGFLTGGTFVGDNTKIACAIRTSGTAAIYSQTSDAFSTNTWYSVLLNYDGSAGTNDTKVQLFFNGSDQAPLHFVETPPTALATYSDAANIGSDGSSAFAGSIAELAIWTGDPGGQAVAAVAASLAQGYSPAHFRKNGLHYFPLTRDSVDKWGAATQTITGTTVVPGPRILNPVGRPGPRRLTTAAAAGGGANLIAGRLIDNSNLIGGRLIA